MFTFRYKLFRAPRLRHVLRKTQIARDIWNYFLGWQRLRYSQGMPYMSYKEMSREFTKHRNAHPDIFGHWRTLDSWAARQILKRLDMGYQRFFTKLAKRPPKFKSWRSPYSFTMGPSGYGFAGDKVRIMKKHYRFNLHRPILGNVKTVTLKADTLADIYMSVTTDYTATEILPKTGNAAGYDFGIKTMFTCSDSIHYESPEYYKASLKRLAMAQRHHSRKVKGSGNRERSRKAVARVHRNVKRQRDDWHWKLAKQFVNQYDVLCFETLTFEGMKRLWGRKVSDSAPHAFHRKLQHQAQKHGKQLCYIDRFEPTSKTCSHCGQLEMWMSLDVREWQCAGCKRQHNRDVNAAINILKVGISTFGIENVTLANASRSRRRTPSSKPHNPCASTRSLKL